MYTQKKFFQRRKDLTVQKRFLIAYIVLFQCNWGTITHLSRKYNISRQFIYDNAKFFSDNFEETKDKTITISKEEAKRYILSFRFEGKCSIPSISDLMKRQGLPTSSVGYISQTLFDIGNKIGNKLNIDHVDGFTFSICSDEIFSKQNPILITLDPVSFLILRIDLKDNRSKDSWVEHFENIKSQNISVTQITNDEGTGMNAAVRASLSDAERQSDTFHAVAHRLGLYVERLFKKAYSLLELQTKLEVQFENSKSERQREKYLEKVIKIYEQADKAVELYEDFEIIYHWLLECFQAFDKKGKLKDVQKVKADFDVALECLKELNYNDINKEIKSIENCKSDLFTFYKTAKEKIDLLSQTIDNEVLNLLSLAWQVNKNAIKSKNTNRKNKLKRREQYILNDVKELVGNEQYEAIKQTVYQTLNHIIQSSAAVECINSLLRYYLNSSNNKVTQETLNMFMFFHNHRRFKNGKRKGQTPMEIATNSIQEKDWIELLLEKAK